MPRRPLKQKGKASSKTMAFVGAKKKRREENAGKKRATRAGKQTVAKYKDEAQVFLDKGDWSEANASHFVGMYAVLFEYVYKVALDIKGNDWRGACSAARAMLKNEFNEDNDHFIAYVRWVWSREDEREKWRRENNKSGQVIGWRLMFSSRNLLTEYKVHLARKTGA